MYFRNTSTATLNRELSSILRTDATNGAGLYFITSTYRISRTATFTPESAVRNLAAFQLGLMHYLFGSHWSRRWARDRSPKMYCFLDQSFSRNKKYDGPVKHETGWHHHSLVGSHPDTVNKFEALTNADSATAFCQQYADSANIKSLHVSKILNHPDDIARVVGYAAAFYFSPQHEDYRLTVFPKSTSELSKPIHVKGDRSNGTQAIA